MDGLKISKLLLLCMLLCATKGTQASFSSWCSSIRTTCSSVGTRIVRGWARILGFSGSAQAQRAVPRMLSATPPHQASVEPHVTTHHFGLKQTRTLFRHDDYCQTPEPCAVIPESEQLAHRHDGCPTSPPTTELLPPPAENQALTCTNSSGTSTDARLTGNADKPRQATCQDKSTKLKAIMMYSGPSGISFHADTINRQLHAADVMNYPTSDGSFSEICQRPEFKLTIPQHMPQKDDTVFPEEEHDRAPSCYTLAKTERSQKSYLELLANIADQLQKHLAKTENPRERYLLGARACIRAKHLFASRLARTLLFDWHQEALVSLHADGFVGQALIAEFNRRLVENWLKTQPQKQDHRPTMWVSKTRADVDPTESLEAAKQCAQQLLSDKYWQLRSMAEAIFADHIPSPLWIRADLEKHRV